jgi:hypothetical protein
MPEDPHELLDRFLDEECDEYVANLLLDEIASRLDGKRKFSFNIFDVEIDIDRGTATLTDVLAIGSRQEFTLPEFKSVLLERTSRKPIKVREVFTLVGRDCLTVVASAPGLISKGAVLDNSRGIRVQIVAIELPTPERHDLVAFCVQPKDADLKPGDALWPIPNGPADFVEVVPPCPVAEGEHRFAEWLRSHRLSRDDLHQYEIAVELGGSETGDWTRYLVRRDALRRLGISEQGRAGDARPDFEVSTTGEVRRLYKQQGVWAQRVEFDEADVPESLRCLIPLARVWGIGDDVLRDDLRRRADPQQLRALKKAVVELDDELDAWLTSPAELAAGPTAAYLAFTNLRLVADAVPPQPT